MDYAWFLFSFKGRINRARYLVVQLALLTFWLILWRKFSFHFSSQWQALHWVVAIAMIWINAATTVKRLHDRNMSGWWAVAIFIVSPTRITVFFSDSISALIFRAPRNCCS